MRMNILYEQILLYAKASGTGMDKLSAEQLCNSCFHMYQINTIKMLQSAVCTLRCDNALLYLCIHWFMLHCMLQWHLWNIQCCTTHIHNACLRDTSLLFTYSIIMQYQIIYYRRDCELFCYISYGHGRWIAAWPYKGMTPKTSEYSAMLQALLLQYLYELTVCHTTPILEQLQNIVTQTTFITKNYEIFPIVHKSLKDCAVCTLLYFWFVDQLQYIPSHELRLKSYFCWPNTYLIRHGDRSVCCECSVTLEQFAFWCSFHSVTWHFYKI